MTAILDDFEAHRLRMVDVQIRARGVADRRVLSAMEKVPRHLFVPEEMRAYAYADEPLPIGEGQTISQPYIVAYMTEALRLRGGERVLEIGTGSGYQTAILAELAGEVFSVEVVRALSAQAAERLQLRGYRNIMFKVGDGTQGWEEFAPFDAIVVTAAPRDIPKPLENQLKTPGRMIIPVGWDYQELVLVKRDKKGYKRQSLISVRFVPLITVQ